MAHQILEVEQGKQGAATVLVYLPQMVQTQLQIQAVAVAVGVVVQALKPSLETVAPA